MKNIYKLNEKAKLYKSLDDIQQEILVAFIEQGSDFDKALKLVNDRNYIYIEGNTDQEFLKNYLDMVGGKITDAISKEEMHNYFNFEEFGRDLTISEFKETDNGYIDSEGYEIIAKDEEELAEKFIDEVYGGPENLSENTLELYFDYDKFTETIMYDFYPTENGYVRA